MDENKDVIVYQIQDFTLSLQYAYEKLQEGYHVSTLVFTKEQPKPKPQTHDILLMEGC